MPAAALNSRAAPGRRRHLGAAVLTLALAQALASCAPKPPPAPPPPPPPPPVVVIPDKPVPPDGSAPNLIIPQVDSDGTRESVNRKVSINQVIWNLRSAYTVAALDCREPRHVGILARYRQFLDRNAKPLKSVYDRMDREFRDRYGRGGETLRDDYLTMLYNHYALPPTMSEFCDVVDQAMIDGAAMGPDQLATFAAAKVPVIEKVFDDFYERYDKYRNALAAWEEKYGRVGRVRVEQMAQEPPPRPVAPDGTPFGTTVPARPVVAPGAPVYGPVITNPAVGTGPLATP